VRRPLLVPSAPPHGYTRRVLSTGALKQQEDVMAKGQARTTKEKKKPKADKNKKQKHVPFGGKMPANSMSMPGKK
jgi:hypothetical protein